MTAFIEEKTKYKSIDKNHALITKCLYLDGKLNNDGSRPAVTKLNEKGDIIEVKYFINGKPNREDLSKPICIKNYIHSGVRKEEYILDSNSNKTMLFVKNELISITYTNNKDSKYNIVKFKNGRIHERFFYDKDELLDYNLGPSKIRYYDDGEVKQKVFIKKNTSIVCNKNLFSVWPLSLIKFNLVGEENIDTFERIENYSKSGKLLSELYLLNGRRMKDIKFLIKLGKVNLK